MTMCEGEEYDGKEFSLLMCFFEDVFLNKYWNPIRISTTSFFSQFEKSKKHRLVTLFLFLAW
jgi:hypothetical protein